MAQQQQQPEQMVLYGHAACPYSQRLWITLNFHQLNNGLEFKHEQIPGLGIKPEWFKEKYRKALASDPNSDGATPVLGHGDRLITESDLTVSYVDTLYMHRGGPTLMPKDNYKLAQVEVFVRNCMSRLSKSFMPLLKATDSDEVNEHRKNLLAAWEYIAVELEKAHTVSTDSKEDAFFDGTNLTLADVMVWPFFNRLGIHRHYRDFNLPAQEPYARLFDWDAAMRQHPAVKPTVCSDEFLVAEYVRKVGGQTPTTGGSATTGTA